jgi:hypothetical protein
VKYNAKKIDLTLLHMADALKDLGQRGFPRFNKEVDMLCEAQDYVKLSPCLVVFWRLFQYFTTHNSVSLARLFSHCRTSGVGHGVLFLILGASVLSSIRRFSTVTEPLQKLRQRHTSQLLGHPGATPIPVPTP